MMHRLFIYIFLTFLSVAAVAEDTRFVMSAPNAVETGQQFRLSFSLNERGSNLQLPPGLSDNFDVLFGPSTGQSTSIRTINGKTTQERTYSYTYVLRAKKEGNFEIRPASIEVSGKVFESNPLKIQVVKARSKTSTPQQGNQPQQQGDVQNADLGEENLFVRVDLNKSSVYRGEQIIATVKLYVNPNINISGFDEVNLPTYEGFYTQDIEIPQQINFTREVFNDRIYQVGVLKKTILFPQQNGKITIKPFSMAILVQQMVKARSFFDDFFGSYRTVRAPMTSKVVNVNVKQLPPEPANFQGGVGNFSLSSEISSEKVTTNDAVTLTIRINGSGNIRLIRNPELELPSDFEVYDPRATDNVKATSNGASGTKTIEYLFQPRFEGEYTIPPVTFTYFDPASGKYQSKRTPEYTLQVGKGSEEQATMVTSARRKEDVRFIGQDIRFIKQGDPLLFLKGYTFFGSTWFYLSYLIGALAFLALYIIYRKKIRESNNIALSRNKKANRVASKRLKAAYSNMKANNNEAFHEEILKAFQGYLSDKLGIPVADLNRETAVARLKEVAVQEDVIMNYNEVVDQCEFARYAPSSAAEARNELYKKAEWTMSRFEKQIKR